MEREKEFLKLVQSNKETITALFNDYKERDPLGYAFTSGDGELTIEDLIEGHARAWMRCNFNGVSSSLAYYAEDFEVIKYMSKIWKKHKNNQQ